VIADVVYQGIIDKGDQPRFCDGNAQFRDD